MRTKLLLLLLVATLDSQACEPLLDSLKNQTLPPEIDTLVTNGELNEAEVCATETELEIKSEKPLNNGHLVQLGLLVGVPFIATEVNYLHLRSNQNPLYRVGGLYEVNTGATSYGVKLSYFPFKNAGLYTGSTLRAVNLGGSQGLNEFGANLHIGWQTSRFIINPTIEAGYNVIKGQNYTEYLPELHLGVRINLFRKKSE